MGKRWGGWKLQPTLKTSKEKTPMTTPCVCVFDLQPVLIARLKCLYLNALRDGKEGRRVAASTHTQNIERKTPMTTLVCV